MEKIWFNEVYEFAYGKFEGDHDKALKFAEDDCHVKIMQEALKKEGCTE